MRKRFNDAGVCVAHKHYMADTSKKVAAIMELIEDGSYFTINRPRQYGKTTIAHLMYLKLVEQGDYIPISISFEGIGDVVFEKESTFCQTFIRLLIRELKYDKEVALVSQLGAIQHDISTLEELSEMITQLIERANKKIVVLIDEIDKSSNNQLFLSFLGMLRQKYLQQNVGRDHTFQSVILIGVHDIKSLKLKIAPETTGKLNSPWNIAIDFKVDLSFSPKEIQFMLESYAKDKGITMDTDRIAQRIHFYTSGYPYLTSKICKIIDEDMLPRTTKRPWTLEDIETAVKSILDEGYTTTLFDSLVKNLENNSKLYEIVFDVIFNGKKIHYNVLDPLVNLGALHGIFTEEHGFCKVHNRIIEQKLYGYMLSKHSRQYDLHAGIMTSPFYTSQNDLNLKNILLRFQQFMKENYSEKDTKFLEREGRLLFLSFLKPIINGKGFDFKEPNIAAERRLDVVITYNKKRYVVELKRWEGNAYHQKGLKQLSDYLDTYSLKEGYLLIFDFRKSKTYKDEPIQYQDKRIFAVWV